MVWRGEGGGETEVEGREVTCLAGGRFRIAFSRRYILIGGYPANQIFQF